VEDERGNEGELRLVTTMMGVDNDVDVDPVVEPVEDTTSGVRGSMGYVPYVKVAHIPRVEWPGSVRTGTRLGQPMAKGAVSGAER